MTNDFTFKTVRTRRPYFAAGINRQHKARRLNFENILGAMCPVDANQTFHRAA